MKFVFKIKCNETELAETIDANKLAIQKFVREVIITSHKGILVKMPYGYNYETTFGCSFKFFKVRQ